MSNPFAIASAWEDSSDASPPSWWNGSAYAVESLSTQAITYIGSLPLASFQFVANAVNLGTAGVGLRTICDGTTTNYTLSQGQDQTITVPTCSATCVIECVVGA